MFDRTKRFLGRRSVIGVVTIGFISGVIFWGGFNTALELTNTESFCISCHEMEDNVYQEYRQTIHYQNRTGVRATCPDCHVPKDWTHKIIRKIEASREVYHKIIGTIDTPKKFKDYRLTMAKSEWRRMKKADSRECRNCHEFESMDYSMQSRRASPQHIAGFEEGKTCIDCHKGIAHKMPDISKMTDEEKAEFHID
ncbi:MAG TPA: cytochrome c-type protein NapC [Leucothrix mucor]|nr:cytochrome c-type protein NapC [Leucothrix mucor]